MRGAVLYGLELKVGEYYMQRHYGLVYSIPFLEGQHPLCLKEIDIDGSKYCESVFDWVAKRVYVFSAELIVELHNSIWLCCKVRVCKAFVRNYPV